MHQIISKCLLALAVLQGAIPADHCILKLAGVCGCEMKAASAADDCCEKSCCAPTDRSAGSHTTSCPFNGDNKKACCAYTPANGLTADAQPVTAFDVYQDCLPTAFAFMTLLETLSAQAAHATFAAHGQDSPQPFDTPVYLRVHSFLI